MTASAGLYAVPVPAGIGPGLLLMPTAIWNLFNGWSRA